MSKKKKTLIICLLIVIALFVSFFVYVSDYYKKDAMAVEVLQSKNIVKSGDYTIFKADNNENALVFYPGGKVEALAYAPLLKNIADNGINCVLVNMPFNLAVFGVNKANGAFELLPEVKNWYIGGHSLGGAMASSYYDGNIDKLKGLILLGAYTSGKNEGNVIEIYGSNDKVLNKEKLLENAVKIEGGNHANFGNYGKQSGDGDADITKEKQQEITVELIKEFIEN